MRIIDKNHDFYDYLQDPTDTQITFDRRGSFLLEKKHICKGISQFGFRRNDNKYNHLLLQCGGTFWVFLLTVTEYEKSYYYSDPEPVNYDIELLATWRNYDKPNKLIDIRIVDISTDYLHYDYNSRKLFFEREKIDPDKIKDSVNRINFDNSSYNNYDLSTLTYDISVKNGYEEKKYTIPLLNACGISNIVNPVDVFCGIEEYFSREKTAAERTEPLGATNNDKIIMHGFDTKTSFRGKYKKEKKICQDS